MEEHVVKSLADYLSLVFANDTPGFYHEVADLKVMYRGQANASWSPIPAAFRSDDDFLNEGFYIREYERQMPEQCAGKTSIEIIIDAQHYGIPTRLLDITSNPLVALYFACLDTSNDAPSDGAVLQFRPSGIFMQDELTCSTVAEYVRRYKNGIHFPQSWKESLARAIARSDFRFSSDADRAVGHFLSGKYLHVFFLPKFTNSRILMQEGAFLLFSTPFVKKKDPGYGDGVFLLPSETPREINQIIDRKYIIPKNEKQTILAQLSRVGISESRLFPDTEHRAKSIVDTIRMVNRNQNARLLSNIS